MLGEVITMEKEMGKDLISKLQDYKGLLQSCKLLLNFVH